MRRLPYDNFKPHEFIVRDWLALDRTVLANERTFLAYGRTALGLILSGLTIVKLFNISHDAVMSGWGFVALGLLVFVVGVRRFLKMQGHYRALSAIEEEALPAELAREFGREISAHGHGSR
ncbi:MAG: DUF202 domain-containing protein [Magnetospirillum sp.]|nr:DUF202 domain-containing protein [Magnetospirillum sp.]